MTPLRLLPLAAALLFCTVATGCKKADGSEGDSASVSVSTGDTTAAPTTALALPVAAVAVREGDLVLTVSTTGQVASDEVSAMRSELAGTVARVFVRPGDRV